jgi:hypothetical protein
MFRKNLFNCIKSGDESILDKSSNYGALKNNEKVISSFIFTLKIIINFFLLLISPILHTRS